MPDPSFVAASVGETPKAALGSAIGVRFAQADEALRPLANTRTTGDAAFLPYRQLAMRVLDRALRDVANPGGSMADRESARTFFAGSGLLFHWCRVAALDPHRVMGRVHTITAGCDGQIVGSGLAGRLQLAKRIT